MPRLVRKKPLLERIQDYLHPADWLLWISEELETRDWDTKEYGNSLAILLHLLTLISQANLTLPGDYEDSVFLDNYNGSGWINSIATIIVYLLSTFSLLNALYTFYRKRCYRLFESSIDSQPRTPSAHRVRVDSSPMSSSPLRFVGNMIGNINSTTTSSPDPKTHVWEIAVWDPLPVCLRLFCLFSPGHVVVYWLFLPTQSMDPRPSITFFKTIVLQILMTVQLLFLQTRFSQQIKDSAIIQKEVMNEYDTKFVHHRMNSPMRDVGTQFDSSNTGMSSERPNSIDLYSPAIILKRGFRTNPNPNYAKHFDPDNHLSTLNQRHEIYPSGLTPSFQNLDRSANLSVSPHPAQRQPQFRRNMSNNAYTTSSTPNSFDGGSLGVYNHANSPLRKAASRQDLKAERYDSPRNSLSMAGREIRDQKDRNTEFEKNHSEEQPKTSENHSNLYDKMGGKIENRLSAPSSSSSSSTFRSKPKSILDQAYGRVPSRF